MNRPSPERWASPRVSGSQSTTGDRLLCKPDSHSTSVGGDNSQKGSGTWVNSVYRLSFIPLHSRQRQFRPTHCVIWRRWYSLQFRKARPLLTVRGGVTDGMDRLIRAEIRSGFPRPLPSWLHGVEEICGSSVPMDRPRRSLRSIAGRFRRRLEGSRIIDRQRQMDARFLQHSSPNARGR